MCVRGRFTVASEFSECCRAMCGRTPREERRGTGSVNLDAEDEKAEDLDGAAFADEDFEGDLGDDLGDDIDDDLLEEGGKA